MLLLGLFQEEWIHAVLAALLHQTIGRTINMCVFINTGLLRLA